MTPSKRECEQALRKAGYSRNMAKQIVASGLPGYRNSLTNEELIELGLMAKPYKGDAIDLLMDRANLLLH